MEIERGCKSRKGVDDENKKEDNGRRSENRNRWSMKWLLLKERRKEMNAKE